MPSWMADIEDQVLETGSSFNLDLGPPVNQFGQEITVAVSTGT